MQLDTIYLNNAGSKFMLKDANGNTKHKISFEKDGATHTATVSKFEMMGNWATVTVKVNGRKRVISEFKLIDN